jgi:hypothetical protein
LRLQGKTSPAFATSNRARRQSLLRKQSDKWFCTNDSPHMSTNTIQSSQCLLKSVGLINYVNIAVT